MTEEANRSGGSRPRHWKDVLIVLLGLLVVVLAVGKIRDGRRVGAGDGGAEDGAESVEVFDVVVDRESGAWVDVYFDRPLGEGSVGSILGRPPATVEPPLGGVWRWREANVLRFEPSGGLPAATEHRIGLIPERILGPGQTLVGGSELEVRSDPFLLEGVDVAEETAPEGDGRVILTGQLRFNHPVDPETLAPLVSLRDPEADENPVVELLESYWTRPAIAFRTSPVQKGAEPRSLELVVDGALTPASGNLPLGEARTHEIHLGSRYRLEVRGVASRSRLDGSSIQVALTSPVDQRVAEKYLSLTPEVPWRVAAAGNDLVLTGSFVPGETYRVEIAEGLPARDEAVLRDAFRTSVRLEDLAPSASFATRGMFLSSTGYRSLAVESVNVDGFRIAVDRVYLNNLFMLFQNGWLFDNESVYHGSGLDRALGDRVGERSFEVAAARNTEATTRVDLGPWVDDGGPGLYRVLLSRPGHWEAEQRWLLMTDLGAVVKRSREEVFVWVSSVTSLAPQAGVEVSIVSDQNQLLAKGRTDGAGLWSFRDPDLLAAETPYLVTLEKGGDFSLLLFDRMGVDTAGLEVGGAPPVGDGYRAFLYGERDLYRPGEKLEGLAIVRDRSLRPAPAMPALVRHRDPRGMELETWMVSIDRRGLAPFDLELPSWALTGRHSLELEIAERRVGTYGFQVEEFVPDRLKVEIERPGGVAAAGPGEDLSYEVAASYLFGPPAAELPVETRVRLEPVPFSPPGLAGFTFGNPERRYEGEEILARRTALDPEGRGAFSVRIPAGLEVSSGLAAVVTARISEPGGRGVTATSRLPVHAYASYLGLRRVGSGHPEPGDAVEIEYVAATPDGVETPAGRLRAELFLDRWQTVLRRTPAGSFRYESTRDTTLVSVEDLAGGSPGGILRTTPGEPGSHRLVLTDLDSGASSSIGFFASGWGYAPWAVASPSRVELDLDREEYGPGETAELQVRAPFPGRLLVTVERDRVLSREVHDLDGNTARITIPIQAAWRPNVYVTATVVRAVGDLEPGSPARAFGAIPLAVDRESHRLTVALEAPGTVRSGEEVKVSLATEPGAVVTLAAVDEGILQLIGQRTPDPFEFFNRRLALAVDSFDTFSLLMPEVGPPAAAGGGLAADARAQYVRAEGLRRVEPVAYWSGPLVADEAGSATVRFTPPDFQGALRFMAVAVGRDEFGSAEAGTLVRDPLVLTPTLPRILSFDESLAIPVTVRNDTGAAGAFQVALTVVGPARVSGEDTRTVELADGREATVYFDLRTGTETGEVEVRLEAEGRGERARAGARVGVRPDLPRVTLEQAGSVDADAVALPLVADLELRPESRSRELRIGPLPLVRFAGKLRLLLGYPYGCLEQTVSKAFPQIYLADLARALDPGLLDGEGEELPPEKAVEEALRKVAQLQVDTGGFAMWPGATTPDPWGSVYAAHFLVEARQAGYQVADSALERSLDHLDDRVKARSDYGARELARVVYALYVLARADRADLGTMDYLREKEEDQLATESRALLAAAYAAIGNTRATGELLAHLGEIERVERQTGGNLDSAVRNRALTLLALLDAEPESGRVAELAERLARDAARMSSWTTQESGFAFIALGRLYRRQAERPPYHGRVFVGDREVGVFGGEATVRFTRLEGEAPVRIVMSPGYEPGSAFFSLLTRGVPTDESFRPVSAGLEVEREFLDRDGAGVDPATVRQGDLLVVRTRVRSVVGPVENVVVQNLLPSGLEVENPRLDTTEGLAWIGPAESGETHLDLRDDRILLFTDLPDPSWRTYYALVRAVSPGDFRLPPVQAEAMYDPAKRATGRRGRLVVEVAR